MRILLTSLDYENFEIYNPTISLDMLVWCIGAGVGAGAVAAYLRRAVIGRAARRLLKAEADTPEKAMTLAEIGLAKNPLVRLALRSGGSLRRVVLCANEAEFAPRTYNKFVLFLRKLFSMDTERPSKTDLSVARFYIPEENKFKTEDRYNAKGQTLPRLILALALIVLVCLGVKFVIPELFTMLDNFITIVSH